MWTMRDVLRANATITVPVTITIKADPSFRRVCPNNIRHLINKK
jgi:hypothetical protein